MRWADIPRSPSESMLRQFGVIGFICFVSIGTWRLIARGDVDVSLVFILVGVVFGAVGLMRPNLLRRVFVTWIVLAFPIGWLISNLVMAAVFFGLLLPIGLYFRIIGRDVLSIRSRREANSYWRNREPVTDPRRYFRLY